MMRLRVLGYAAVVGLFAVTCGGSVDVGSAGSGANSGSGAGSGATAGSGTSAQGGDSTSAMTTDVGSSSSTGTPCSEQPCKLVAPQCGCPDGDKCTLDPTGARICTPDGTVPIGEACGSCVAGSQCISTLGLSICRAYCDADAQCEGPGGQCVLDLSNGMGGNVDATFCSENCDPVTSAGCAPANSKCELGQQQQNGNYFTLCTGAGSGTQGAPCNQGSDCASGHGCLNAGMGLQCMSWCTPQANPQCPGLTSCTSFTTPLIIGNVEYGVCF